MRILIIIICTKSQNNYHYMMQRFLAPIIKWQKNKWSGKTRCPIVVALKCTKMANKAIALQDQKNKTVYQQYIADVNMPHIVMTFVYISSNYAVCSFFIYYFLIMMLITFYVKNRVSMALYGPLCWHPRVCRFDTPLKAAKK